MNYSQERKWIRKKLESGTSQLHLKNSVGMFSNKKKEDVMKKKNLNEKQYKKRWNFLFNVYSLLCDEEF